MKLFRDEIKKLNPGRQIVIEKICPYLKSKCITSNCNAFAEDFDIKIVTLEDKISYEDEDADIPWEANLDKQGWKLKCSSTSEIGPDNQDSLYIKRRDEHYYGRCLI